MEPWLERFARVNFARSSDTAHDLKTPLNVAVLNLELLRMRVRKLAGDEDEKAAGYMRAIEVELRRMAQIFDAFFLLSTPPKSDEPVSMCDIAPLLSDAAAGAGVPLEIHAPLPVNCYTVRISQALKLLFGAATRLFTAPSARLQTGPGSVELSISGKISDSATDLTKIFKFYYTDPLGTPDLSLAAVRLIAETFGGSLDVEEGDPVTLRLKLPLGEQ